MLAVPVYFKLVRKDAPREFSVTHLESGSLQRSAKV